MIAALELPRRLRGIDAARAVAALSVLLSHIVLVTTVRSPAWVEAVPLDIAERIARWMGALGAWGVGLFFVLSGLCIHLPMARRLAVDPGARLELRPYYIRRFTRIYPPHLVALLASALVALALPPLFLRGTLLTVPTWRQLAAHLAMVHSFVPGAIFSVSSVLWTIALETHFYLLYPLLLLARRRFRIEIVCAVLFGISIALRLITRHYLSTEASVVLDYSFLRRYWEWSLGCVIAERLIARPRVGWSPRSATGALLLGSYVLGVLILDLPLGGALQTTLWPLLFAAAIELAARQRTSEGSLIERALAWVGHTSYSLYLTHPIALAAAVFFARSRGAPPPGEAAAGLLSSILLSAAFFYSVERPFLKRASHASATRAPAPAPSPSGESPAP